jgi:hypothetical protein
MRRRFPPRVYVALRDAGYSNREIAGLLGVNESSVRRGLKSVGYNEPSRTRQLLTELADRLDFHGV